MKWLTLERIKQQCRIEPDFHDEDEWLEDTGEMAEDSILEHLNRSYEDLFEVYGRIPAPVRRATLMLVDSAYQFRSKDVTQQMNSNPTFTFLLKPYMRLATGNVNDNENDNNSYGCKNL